MKIIGNLTFLGGGQAINMIVESVVSDPVSPASGQIWYNSSAAMYRGYDGSDVIDLGRDEALALEVDNIEAAMGSAINTDGTYNAHSGSNYIDGNANVTEDLTDLDTQVKANADGIAGNDTDITNLQSELNTTQAGAGLGTDGSYTANGGANYISGASDLQNADDLLDAQVKTNADNIATNTTDISTNDTDITNLQNDKVAKSGDTMSGNLVMGNNTVTGLGTPSAVDDAATKGYVDGLLSGLDFQPDVLNVQTDATLDPGTSPADGDRYIITASGTLHANFGTIAGIGDGDIVEAASGTFSVVYDVSTAGEGAITWNRNGDEFYVYAASSWSPFGGLAGVTAGAGLAKGTGPTANEIWVNMGAGIIELPSDEVGLDLRTGGGLITTEDGTSSSTVAGAQLAILLDGSTLSLSGAGLEVADAGITETQLNASVAGNGIAGGAGTSLSVALNTVDAGGDNASEPGLDLNANGLSLDKTYLDGRYINTAGDTMSGDLAMGTNAITGLADPTSAQDAATMNYVDTEITSLTSSVNGNDYVYTGTAATSHTVTHSTGQQFCNVTVVDTSVSPPAVVIPDAIKFNSTTQCTVEFTTATACKVIVHGNSNAGTS